MPDPADSSAPDPGTARTTTTYTYGRALLPLLIAAIVVPLVVSAIAVATRRDHIQDDLSGRARAALVAAGFPNAQVTFNGRDATIRGVPLGSAEAARQAVRHLRGVRVAAIGAAQPSTSGSGAPATPAGPSSPAAGPPAPLRIAESGNQLTLIATVPDRATEQAIVRAVTASAGARRVLDHLTVAAGATSSAAPAVVSKLVAALGSGVDRGLSYDGRTVTLTGTVPDDATKAATEKRVRAAVPSATIDNRLSVSAPPAKARLQTRVNAQLKAHPVTFQPDSANLTSQGIATVRIVASLLGNTAGLHIEVDGHVAKTPGNSVNPQALSQQRANTVKTLLVQLGVKGRITAKGFGDSRPVASNSTSAGQAKNRRVEVRLL
jgi:outer membrane protein OmpA-like peptidoglycan-associated protein